MTEKNWAYADWCEPTDYIGINWLPDGDKHPRNLMPEPYQETTVEEFLGVLIGGITAIDYRQIKLPDEATYGEAHFILRHDRAVCVVSYSVGTRRSVAREHGKKGMLIDRGDGWFMRLRFFRIGCTHPNLTTSFPAMHDRVDRCADCGFTASYDTSG